MKACHGMCRAGSFGSVFTGESPYQFRTSVGQWTAQRRRRYSTTGSVVDDGIMLTAACAELRWPGDARHQLPYSPCGLSFLMDVSPSLFVRSSPPFLVVDIAKPSNLPSWSLTRPGFVLARLVVWREVRDEALPLGADAVDLLWRRMTEAGYGNGASHTSRSVKYIILNFEPRAASRQPVSRPSASRTPAVSRLDWIKCPAGDDQPARPCRRPLSAAAHIEALSVAAEARTAAIMDLGFKREGHPVTGTGADCSVIIASPCGKPELPFAGLQTDVGVSLGRAVYEAVKEGGSQWLAQWCG